jgi:hypothetical protein
MIRSRFVIALYLAAVGALIPGPAGAHGLAGRRFFPATLAVDDPFVADELSFPSILYTKNPSTDDSHAARETQIGGELSKRLTPNLGVSLGGRLIQLDPDSGPATTGFDNLEVGLKYQLFTNDTHETIVSLGLGWEVGGTGRRAVGAESFDVVAPALSFGKGFGDLPDAVSFLRPLAVTGLLGARIPTVTSSRVLRSVDPTGELVTDVQRHADVLQWGLAVEYSLPYLQSFVRDVGLPVPLNRLVPVVEVSVDQPLDRGQSGKTTGTINPGIIWVRRAFQIGLEAVVPINARSGTNVGIRAQLHFYFDDLFPKTLGRPIFGP